MKTIISVTTMCSDVITEKMPAGLGIIKKRSCFKMQLQHGNTPGSPIASNLGLIRGDFSGFDAKKTGTKL